MIEDLSSITPPTKKYTPELALAGKVLPTPSKTAFDCVHGRVMFQRETYCSYSLLQILIGMLMHVLIALFP
jgi:hypothetical protein